MFAKGFICSVFFKVKHVTKQKELNPLSNNRVFCVDEKDVTVPKRSGLVSTLAFRF